MKPNPLVSIITPVFNVNLEYFKEAASSVNLQTYDNWEWCICDDGSTDKELIIFLNVLEDTYSNIKIKYLDKNIGITNGTREAVSMAEGKIITFFDSDDELHKDALKEIVDTFNFHDVDIVYTDEALKRMDKNGKLEIHPKPNFSPHYLLASNYICHLMAVKRTLFDKVGGIRDGYEGSQDHDLILRLTHESKKVFHIQKSLYNWRIHQQSNSRAENRKLAIESGVKAVWDEIERSGYRGGATPIRDMSHYKPFLFVKGEPLVNIVIPTFSGSQTYDECVKTLQRVTKYKNYQINTVLQDAPVFNYSKVLNTGSRASNGDYIVFMHDDVFIQEPNWLEYFISYAQMGITGVVSGKLLNLTNHVVEMGGVLGLNGIATSMFHGMHDDKIGGQGRAELLQNTSVVSSSLMMIKRSVFDEVHGFDENFVMNNMDYDLSIRVKETGRFNVIVPECKAIHLQEGRRFVKWSADQKTAIKDADENLFRGKYDHLLTSGDPYYSPYFTKDSGYVLPTKQSKSSRDISTKLVSFIIPWYEEIPVVVPSLVAQTHKNIEIIVYHDGPYTDDMLCFLESFDDERVKVYSTEERHNDWGHTPRSMAIDKLSVDSYATVFTGADNYYLPTYTEEILLSLTADDSYVASYCNMLHNKMNWNTVESKLHYSQIDCGSFMVKTDIAKAFGWGTMYAWEDWIFMEKVIDKYGTDKIKKMNRMLYIHN